MFFYLVAILALLNAFTQESLAEEKCMDRWEERFCKMIKDQNACAISEVTIRAMKEKCAKTCGHC
ncbi:shTK domain protein [Necator americanus]|uniref:ShTK domain protein n=1 Tax=Necator americanus TaxID=51031 RepID=W2T3V4_NECAM|nr:shTK domain protein [Necator americanus]ETN76695.1 shTK domain protein [Necator americanus]